MDNYIQAAFLGALQGLTEFLPISSTAHLVLLEELMGMKFNNKLLEVIVQLGSVLALIVLRFKLIKTTIINLHKSKSSQQFTLNLVISILPVVICGYLFHDFITTKVYNNKIIFSSMIIGGIVLIIAHYSSNKSKLQNISDGFLSKLPKFKALVIGICQAIALIPGISRSGATISGGIFLNLKRSEAIEYSFILSMPTIFAANVYSLYKNIHEISHNQLSIIIISFVCSFISSLLCFNIMIKFLNKQGLLLCGIYRIIMGLVVIGLVL